MEERREGERAFQKVAGLEQRRGRALVQMTKPDGGHSKSSALTGGMRGQAILSHLGGSGWGACGKGLSVGMEVGWWGVMRWEQGLQVGEGGRQWCLPEEEVAR